MTVAPDAELVLEDVEVRWGDRLLVSIDGLRASPGRPLTIIGESGAGKSLLAHAVMGTLDEGLTVTGAMRLGTRTWDLARRESRQPLWGRELALLPQEPMLALDPTMRVLPQVGEGLLGPGRRTEASGAKDRARRLLGSLGLRDVDRSYPHTLSGGMAQRVSYAAATIAEPTVLLVDEPSKGLDSTSLDALAELLLGHARAEGVLVTITHDLQLARRLGGTLAVMRDAHVIEIGPVEDVLTAPQHQHTRRLVDADPSRWPKRESAARPDGDSLITLDDVGVTLGGRQILKGVNARIGEGERWSLVGPSGCGKTTLGNVIAGVQGFDAGAVTWDPSLRPGQIAKLYQDPHASFPAGVPLQDGLRDVAHRFDVDWSRVMTLLEQVGLPAETITRRPDKVSGGELQRIAIIRSMLASPRLVIADEATSRLDLLTQHRTVDVLLDEIDSTGCALVLITHDEALARATTDHVLDLAADVAHVDTLVDTYS